MNQIFDQYWKQLELKAKDLKIKSLRKLFLEDSSRVNKYSFRVDGLFVDFSKNWMDSNCLELLVNLAQSAGLENKIQALFNGEVVNYSENKAATHTLQRKLNTTSEILSERTKLFDVAEKYCSGEWTTAFGKKVKSVVNIGIGGSYLGPKLAVEALTNLQTNNSCKVYFYPSLDDSTFERIKQSVDIESTLFCVSSKSLGTTETLINTQTIIKLLSEQKGYHPKQGNCSFVAATTNYKKAAELGIFEKHVLPFANTIGGRFSVWSSIGFPLLMAIGKDNFLEFLKGAEKMDEHFKKASFESNIPVLMALYSVWYRNFLKLSNYSIIPYDMRLDSLPAWLQQLMMESNGKACDINSEDVEYLTSPSVFGGHGQLSQHAFFQAFHQGNEVIPIDLIGVKQANSSSQEFLLINMLAQSAALMQGQKDLLNNANKCKGNRPSTIILLEKLNACNLGGLLAMYEHMVFVQSVIWNINCFDQPGVELGKTLARQIQSHHKSGTLDQMNLDSSTEQLLKEVLNDKH